MSTEHAMIANFNSNPNIGIYAYCNDRLCLAGKEVQRKILQRVGEILGVPIHRVNIAGTSMIGVFCAGNSNSVLVPSIVFDDETNELEKAGIRFSVIDTRLTALGNNILCNDHGAIVNPDFEDEAIKQIEQALRVRVTKATIAGLDNVGSLATVNSRRCLVSIDATDEEIGVIEKQLKVKCTRGTLGMGLPYISSAIIVNSHGFVVSDHSSGIEIADADMALGFVD